MSSVPEGVTAACCAPPAIVRSRDDYPNKGSFQKFGIFDKAYVTGPEDTDKAVIFVYDIFGYYPTTQQGADILASTFKAKVVMPDFARGDYYNLERYSNPPEGVNVRGEVMKQFFDPSYMTTRVDEIKSVAETLRGEGKTFVGALGLCWGGRVVLNAGSLDPKVLDAVATQHPAGLDESDGDKLLVPVAVFPTPSDNPAAAKVIVEKTRAKPFGSASEEYEYKNMHHGFSGAHAHIDTDEENAKAFADVYNRDAKFFQRVYDSK